MQTTATELSSWAIKMRNLLSATIILAASTCVAQGQTQPGAPAAKPRNEALATEILIFRLVSHCAENGFAISKDEVDGILEIIKGKLDAAGISKEERDEDWRIAGIGLQGSGFQTMSDAEALNACAGLRNSVQYGYPAVFAAKPPTQKSPF